MDSFRRRKMLKEIQLFVQTRVLNRFALQSFTHFNSSKFTFVEAR